MSRDAATPIPLSAINDYLYCPRRAALKLIDGLRGKNEHTLLGDQAHEHVDFPGHEQRAGWTLLRALPLYSDTLALSGKADLVEVRRAPGDTDGKRIAEARPIEYKKGPARPFDNDEAQLCAQALCLEEMFGIPVPAGAIYHAQSQQRRVVEFDAALRDKTRAALAALRALIAADNIPPAELRPQCKGCSLHETCLPEAGTIAPNSSDLYQPRDYKQSSEN
jgi:CRISPR-associated exonuclease Cas4